MIDDHPYRRSRRLSELARRVLRAAEMWAAHSETHAAVQPAHLLLALLLETRSAASSLVRESGVELAHIHAALELAAAIEMQMGIEGALDAAFAHADRFGSHYVGSEHLLLALTTEANTAALLLEVGINLDDLRARVEVYLMR